MNYVNYVDAGKPRSYKEAMKSKMDSIKEITHGSWSIYQLEESRYDASGPTKINMYLVRTDPITNLGSLPRDSNKNTVSTTMRYSL